MINKLENNLLIDENGNCWGESLQDTKQIVDKINEIIQYINDKKQNER